MDVKILKETDKEMEIEITGDKTIAVLLKSYLVQDENVEFAAFALGHPLEGKTKLFVRVKSGNLRDVVKAAVERAKADFIMFRTAFEEAMK